MNVVVYRVPLHQSVLYPYRSFCPKCKTTLRWYENIPVLSWVLQRGRCRHCKSGVSLRYPVVELLSLGAAILSFYKFGPTPTALVVYILSAMLIAISAIDLDHKIIPDVISIPGAAIGLVVGAIASHHVVFEWPIVQSGTDSLLGFYLGGGVFYLISLGYYKWSGKVGLGFGDVKLMAMLGALLGWQCLMTTIFVGSLVGSLVGIIFMKVMNSDRYTYIPFGPFLAIGALAYIFSNVRTMWHPI